MFFEITDHIRSECVGEQRVITSVNSVGFTSKKLDENGEPTGKDIHMDWEKAKNWRFDNDNITSLQNDNRILMTFHIVDSIERSKNAEQEEKPNQTVNSTQEMQNKPEVGMITLRKVGDFWECYGKNAVIAAEILDIHLTQKNGRDMCGFPDFKYDEYRQRLREAGYTILVEEVFNLNPTEHISFNRTDIQPIANDENTAEENYTPKINDVVEYEGAAYKIADISGGFLTLQEAETLIPATRIVAIDSFFSNAHSVLSEAVTKTAMPLVENNRNSPMGNFEKQNHSANFVITDENFGAVGGAKTRFKLNIEAIRLLKTIESENRTATPDEQQILSNYTGWGAIPQAFDPNNDKWQKEYEELQELLSESEYRAARQSTMNAHYTAPIVISAIYNALENMGFESGRILEPSMGIGNFFGRLPESMQDSKLYGVELDSITGRIAQQLYPSADIQVKGFERTKFPDNFFDIAVSNVPFGDYKLNDKRYNDLHLNIHDYFFAKSLDKVHAGGIVAFVTSKGTLDKENSEVRKYLAERAEFLGAIRLPNNTSKANAGTEVTADIIFLQKRERPITIDPEKSEWINKAENADGFSINKYFVDHPEMVLGKIVEGNKLYGSQANDTSCIPIEGANLKDQLAEAVKNIKGTYKAAEKEITIEVNEDEIPVPENVRTFSYYADNGNLYFYEDGNTMKKVDAPKDRINRAIGMVEMRDTVRELLDLQLNNSDFSLDGEINACRKKLNKLYDDFVKKYGNVSDRKNAKALKGDSGYSIVSALEVKDNKGNVIGKADIFNKNTLKPKIITDHVDTAQEALILSISEMGKIDFDFMQSLCGIDKDKMIEQLDGQIFRLPQEEEKYVTSDEYLSGNIRKKIREIENCYDPKAYEKNKNALQEVLPPRVEAKDIAVKLGANWVDTIYIRQFIEEKFKPDAQTSAEMKVAYSNAVGAWKIENVNSASKTNHLATSTFGTSRKNAYEILEAILNNGDLTVKDHKKDKYGNDILDSNGRFVYVPNDKETKAVRACANLIKSEYSDWIFKDPERREKLVNKYNETYNSYRYREYDGSHLNFVGMTTEIKLKPHQKDAIARGLFGGNTMLAHCVGAGKTYEMIAIAMEGKRLGLHNKSLFAVPNTITEQVGGDFLKLYPNANILVATPKDFEKKNRKALFAKIATGDWDAVIVGHSQFDRMGLSPKRESAYITSEVNRLRSDLDTIVFNDPSAQKSFSVKQIEKTLKSYEERLEKLKDAQVKDDFIDFEQLGFDKIFVDESHMYKNLATPTKMRNVSGLGSRGSARAFNLLMKAKYLDDLTGGKGTVFASGTPISNSMTELYTLMRYLQSDILEDLNIHHFDEWATVFGEVTTDYELKPESDGKYQLKTRFAKFQNLPELMAIFKQAADIRTADTLDLEKPNSIVQEIVAQPSKIQKRQIKYLGARASKIRSGGVDSAKDNMLCVTNDGRKIGLDQRLINPMYPDEPNSKVNMCVQNVAKIYAETSDNRSTQCIFCDMSTPKTESRQDRFMIFRPNAESDNGFEVVRKKNGISKGMDFSGIKSYVAKNANDEDDKLKDGDIAVIRRPNADLTQILSEAAIFENGNFNTLYSNDLLESLEMSPIEDMPPKEFNVYDDIKNKLVERGIPENEIAYIHDYEKPEEKLALFSKMNAGEVRVLLGSTEKCGAGMNAQNKMIALHHLDAPMRPSDVDHFKRNILKIKNAC